MSSRDAIEELSALFMFLADTDFHGYCPIYERLARSVADDRDLLEFIASAVSPGGRRGRVPVLFLAATHDAALADPESELAGIYGGSSDADPYPALLALLADNRDAVATTMANRSVQTNEVGRCAALAPAISHAMVGDPRPVALVEVGPSAGLNLFYDRYRVDYLVEHHDGGNHRPLAEGPPDSSVRLESLLRGDRIPPLVGAPDIVVRTGVDLAPVDITDPVQRRWLQACIWPGVPRRTAVLKAALDLVGPTPPDLVCGDAVTDLAPLVRAQPGDAVVVVVSTWAMAYIPAAGRQHIVDALDEIGFARDLMLVTLEEPRFTPWLDVPTGPVADSGDGTITALGVRSWRGGQCSVQVLAMCHPHARWMQWMA